MKKLAILGKLPTKFKAPFGNKNYDIWTFNYHNEQLEHIDLWFDIHSYNPNPIADIKRENFPFKECHDLLGGYYFNNSVSYILVYAYLKGYKHIELYGMKFEATHETKRNGEYQNVREIIFFLKAKGITITSPYDPEMTAGYKPYGI